jgi:hypothetical protein
MSAMATQRSEPGPWIQIHNARERLERFAAAFVIHTAQPKLSIWIGLKFDARRRLTFGDGQLARVTPNIVTRAFGHRL